MKIKTYPFTLTHEEKTSKLGKQYDSIGIGMSEKNKDGVWSTKWINLIDPSDLLTLASACEQLYWKIYEGRATKPMMDNIPEEYMSGVPVSDDIPF